MTDLATHAGVMEETFIDWATPGRIVAGMGITLLAWIILCLVLVIL